MHQSLKTHELRPAAFCWIVTLNVFIPFLAQVGPTSKTSGPRPPADATEPAVPVQSSSSKPAAPAEPPPKKMKPQEKPPGILVPDQGVDPSLLAEEKAEDNTEEVWTEGYDKQGTWWETDPYVPDLWWSKTDGESWRRWRDPGVT